MLNNLDIGEHGIVSYPDFVYAELARSTRVISMSKVVSEREDKPKTGGKGEGRK